MEIKIKYKVIHFIRINNIKQIIWKQLTKNDFYYSV